MNNGFRGKHYARDEEVKTAMMKWLKEQSTEFYKEEIHVLIRKWNIAIESREIVTLLRSKDGIHILGLKKKALLFTHPRRLKYINLYTL